MFKNKGELSLADLIGAILFSAAPLLYGMCDSLQPAIGYNWGAGKFSRVRTIEKYCFVASGIISMLTVLVIFLFPEQISKLFMASISGQTLETAIFALQMFGVTYVTRWFSFATLKGWIFRSGGSR